MSYKPKLSEFLLNFTPNLDSLIFEPAFQITYYVRMKSRIYKTILILTSFIFLTGFVPFTAFVGPGITIASTGNVYKASAQYLIDNHVKNKTGKNSLAYVKEEVTKYNKKEDINADLKRLIEKRIQIAQKRLAQQNEQNYLNKDLRLLVEKRIKIVRKKFDIKKINQ